MNQGVWIDIFPFDNVPPFTNNKQAINFEIARELFIACKNPNIIKQALEKNQRLLISVNDMKNFLKLTYRQRGKYFDSYTMKTFAASGKVGQLNNHVFASDDHKSYDLKDFEKTVYLPFEKIELPAPAGWENCLTAQYGDWRKMVFTHTHSQDYSVDIPYTEYYKTSAFMK